MAIDGANNIWLSNTPFFFGSSTISNVGALSEFNNQGTAISPATGYSVGRGSLSLAIDSSGNVWWPGVGTLSKCVGVAAPVVTPIAVATQRNKLGQMP